MKRRVFLDTNVLICLTEFHEAFSFFLEKLGAAFEHVQFSTPDICINETKSVLSARGVSANQITNDIERLKKLLKLEVINSNIQDWEVGATLGMLYKPKLHKPDSTILAVAKRVQVWRFYTTDNHFLECIAKDGIDGRKFPTVDTMLKIRFS